MTPSDPILPRRQSSFFGRRKGHKLRPHQASLVEHLLPRLALDIATPAPQRLMQVFERPQNVFKFALATLISAMFSPSLGVTSLALGGFAQWANFWQVWLTWWLGDMSGILVGKR